MNAAAALAPADWRAHECDENVLRPVRGAIKSAADKLGRPIDFSQLLTYSVRVTVRN